MWALLGIGDIQYLQRRWVHTCSHQNRRRPLLFFYVISVTPDALSHHNRATTSRYVQRISIKRDLYSEGISERLKRKTEENSAG
jgi:hypothetical protein